MLVLSRRVNETIVIRVGGAVVAEITVVEQKGDKVRIGVQANKDVAVNRGEVDEAIYGKEVNQ